MVVAAGANGKRRASLRPPSAGRRSHGPCGTGAGAKASFTTRSTAARLPSTTGTSPPSSSRDSSTRPWARTDLEAEVGEEVAREDRAVDEEALVRGLPLGVAVGERLERLRALVARLADRGEEERLLDPRRRARDDVDARDEHGIVGRWAGRKLGGAREERRRAVLDRAEQASVVVAVERAPGAPLVLGLLDPAVLRGRAAVARLPPDAGLADAGRVLERCRRSGRRRAVPFVHDHVDGVGTDVGHPREAVGDVRLHLAPTVAGCAPQSSATCSSTATCPRRARP